MAKSLIIEKTPNPMKDINNVLYKALRATHCLYSAPFEHELNVFEVKHIKSGAKLKITVEIV